MTFLLEQSGKCFKGEKKQRYFPMESVVVVVWGRHSKECKYEREVRRWGLKREQIESQPATEIDKRKVGSEKETVGTADERVDRVGGSALEERYRHRNSGSGEGNENQMQKERDEGRGVEEK